MIHSYFRDTSIKDPDTESCRNSREVKNYPEVLREGSHQEGGDERASHGSPMIHCSLKAKSLSHLILITRLREQCISRRASCSLAHSIKESEKEDVIGRGGESHEGSGEGGEGVAKENDPLSSLKTVR